MLSPSGALILCFCGFLGILAELWRPGSVWPGTLGLSAVVAAFYFWWQLSPSSLGLGLIAGGVVLFAAEATWRISFVAGAAGTVTLGFGLCRLFQEESTIRPALAAPVSLIIGASVIFLSYSAKRARQNKRADL